MSEWQERNVAYWDNLAPDYDDLHASPWRGLENDQVSQELAWIKDIADCRVIDVGCGTGLGYAICRALSGSVQYIGLDISPQMIAQCRQRWPGVTFRVGTMSDLGAFDTESFDAAISIFSSFSCTEDPHGTVAEIHRVLKPGGRAFVTMLNRRSLRRLISLKLNEREEYHARGRGRTSMTVPMRVFEREECRALFSRAGFDQIEIGGHGVLAGVLELSGLWQLNAQLSRKVPGLCHELVVQATKVVAEEASSAQ